MVAQKDALTKAMDIVEDGEFRRNIEDMLSKPDSDMSPSCRAELEVLLDKPVPEGSTWKRATPRPADPGKPTLRLVKS